MNCEICDMKFFDDKNVKMNYLIHKIIFHGDRLN